MPNELEVTTVTELLKKSQNQLFGKYRGIVRDNVDPEKKGRLKLEVPSVFGTTVTDWVIGAFPFGGSTKESMLFIPAIGAQVLVEFVEGDKASPVWTATYYPADGTPENGAAPPPEFDLEQGTLHQIRTEMGIELRFEDDRVAPDDGGSQQIVLKHPRGTEIRIDAQGIVTIADRENASLLLDPENKIVRLAGHSAGSLEMTDDALTLAHGDGTSIRLTSSGIDITGGALKLDGDSVALGKGASAPVMNAQAFATEFASHVHPCPSGSTSAPAPPNPLLAQSVSFSKVTGA